MPKHARGTFQFLNPKTYAHTDGSYVVYTAQL